MKRAVWSGFAPRIPRGPSPRKSCTVCSRTRDNRLRSLRARERERGIHRLPTRQKLRPTRQKVRDPEINLWNNGPESASRMMGPGGPTPRKFCMKRRRKTARLRQWLFCTDHLRRTLRLLHRASLSGRLSETSRQELTRVRGCGPRTRKPSTVCARPGYEPAQVMSLWSHQKLTGVHFRPGKSASKKYPPSPSGRGPSPTR